MLSRPRDQPHPEHGEALAQKTDDEVRRIVSEVASKRETLPYENRDAVVRLVDAFLEQETLTGAEASALIEQ